ncbi:hypothetical protein B5S33_g2863 [[Candida] boidinii]|nr:hypothetical protein B5S30_g2690 [[Candida] boidinii]OWB84221.1 hypothetical protein B5S33_g2863 [[Candida] boidinii]GMF97763.1 unnamed protein product [[Candida] boidinii]
MSSRVVQSPAAAAAAVAATNSNNASNSNYQQNISTMAQYPSTNNLSAAQLNSPSQQQTPTQQIQQQTKSQLLQNSSQQNQQQQTAASSSSGTSSSQVVGLHYKIGKKIGEGSFGVIFEGANMINGIPVAIKFEPRKTEAPQLRDEYRTYKHLNGVKGIPNAYYFGQEGLHNILVIDLLGPSLEDLFDWCNRKFSVKTVVQVAVQMITLIQRVHENDLIYRDIKPDNFLIGRHGLPDENEVHLVDFGMAKQYRDPRTKQHIPYREKKSLSGTARYMSVNTHLGREQSRRDDLEALGHVFFYFLRGQLPWQGLKAPNNKQKYEKIGEKKRTTPVYDLCEGYPRQFAQYLENVRNLQFEAEPDYEGYRRLLLSALDDLHDSADGHYDWMDLNNGRGWDATINKKPNLHGYGHPNPPGERRRHHQDRRARNQQQQQQIQQQIQQQSSTPQTGAGQQGAQQGQSGVANGANGINSQQANLHISSSQQNLQNGGTNERPLPTLPNNNNNINNNNNTNLSSGNYNQQIDTSQTLQQQPTAIHEPVKIHQKNGEQKSIRSNKGFFSSFACCN